MEVLKIKNLSKAFDKKYVFKAINMEVKAGSFIAICGNSGCGKSTLLNIIGLLDGDYEGEMTLFQKKGIKPYSFQAEKILRDKIGYLFQNFALVDDETVEYNMLLAMENSKMKKEMKRTIIKKVLQEVGLKGCEKQKVFECSGGEQQRIAVARLLLKPCELILADEPTGSLDEDNKKDVFKLLQKLNEQGKTIIMVTHDAELAKKCDSIIQL